MQRNIVRIFLSALLSTACLSLAHAEDSATFTLSTPRYYKDSILISESPAFIKGERGSFTSLETAPSSATYAVDATALASAWPGYCVSNWVLSAVSGTSLEGTKIQNQLGGTSFTVTFDYKWAAKYGTSLELIVYLAPMTYDLTYDANGGTWTTGEPESGLRKYSQAETAPAKSAISRAGYALTGWQSSTGKTLAPGASFTGSTLGVTENEQDVALTAQWSANTYALQLTPGKGIAAIYYKTNDMQTAWCRTERETTVPMLSGTTWFAYAMPKAGYTYTKTSAELPMSGEIKTAGATFKPEATANVMKVRYEPNESTDSRQMSDETFTYDVPKELAQNIYYRTYHVYYYSDGSLRDEDDVVWTFSGWNDCKDGSGDYFYKDGETVTNPCGSTGAAAGDPDAIVHLYAQWSGGEVALPLPTKAGCDFSGWYTALEGGQRVGGAGSKFTATSITKLYAHWRPHVTKLEFIDGDQKKDEYAHEVTYGGKYGEFGSLPELTSDDPQKIFLGWYTEKTGGTKITDETKVDLTDDEVKLYAQWETVTYTITYETNGGTINEYAKPGYSYGQAFDLPKDVTRTGHEFLGWYGNQTFEGDPVTCITSTDTGDKTFYAKWSTVAGDKVVFTFVNVTGYTSNNLEQVWEPIVDETTPILTQTHTAGDSVSLPQALFAKEGLTQTGWRLAGDGTTHPDKWTKYSLGKELGTVTEDCTFHTVWQTNTYTVVYNGNGGKHTQTGKTETRHEDINYGSSEKMLSTSAWIRDGYTCVGWALTPTGHTVYTNKMEVSNLTAVDKGIVNLYAVWEKDAEAKTYSLHFSPGADVVNPMAMTNWEHCVSGEEITPDCLYTNLYSDGFIGWIYGGNTNKTITPVAAFDGQIITVQAAWKNLTPNQYSAAVGLTNATLTATGWSTQTSGGVDKSKASCLKADSSKDCTLTMQVNGSGKITYYWYCDEEGGIASNVVDNIAENIESATAWEEKSINVTDEGMHQISWFVPAQSKVGKPPQQQPWFYIDKVRWIPDARTNALITSSNPSEGGTTEGDGSYALGVTATLTATPNEDEGYQFVQWNDGSTEANHKVTVWGDITNYVATFSKSLPVPQNYYYIDFDGNGAASGAMAEQTNVCGQTTALASNAFVRTGYTFGGWVDKNGVTYMDGQEIVDDLATTNRAALLKAVWKPTTYRIDFDKTEGKGTMGSVLDCPYGTSCQLPACTFTCDKMAFAGWATNATGEAVYADGAIVRDLSETGGVVTLYAKWSGSKQAFVEITGHTATKYYTGRSFTVSGYDVDITSAGYYEKDFTTAPGVVTSITETDVKYDALGNVVKYDMGLTEDSFSNKVASVAVQFDVTDGWLEILPSKIGGEPGNRTVQTGGLSKFDATVDYGTTFDGTTISNAFANAYEPCVIEYGALETGPWSMNAPTFMTAGTTSFWYRVTMANREPFVYEVAVEVLPQRDIAEATMDSIGDQKWTGEPLKPEVRVRWSGTALVEGTDYYLTYENNTDPGEATAYVYGMGSYTGTKTAHFNIIRAFSEEPGSGTVPEGGLSKFDTVIAYDGTAHSIDINALTNAFAEEGCAITNIEYAIVEDGPWTIVPIAITNVGATSFWYRVVAVYSTPFAHQAKVTVTPRDIAKATVAPISNQVVTGEPIEPAVTVKDGNPSIMTSADYDVAYSNNVVIGTATVTLTGKGNYTGTRIVTFQIVHVPGIYVNVYGDEVSVNLQADFTNQIKSVSGLPSGLKYKNGYVTGKAKKVQEKTVIVKFSDGTAKTVTWTVSKGVNNGVKIDFGESRTGESSATIDVGSTNLSWAVTADAGAKVKFSKLPSGLKYNKKTGAITGAAKKAGTYELTVKTTAGGWTKVQTFAITVRTLPEYMIGTYYGAATNVTSQSVEAFKLKLTKAGKVLGWFRAAGKKVSFKSTAVTRTDKNGDTNFTTAVTYKYGGVKRTDTIMLATTNSIRGAVIWWASLRPSIGNDGILVEIDAQRDVIKDIGGVTGGTYEIKDASFAEGEYLNAKMSAKGVVRVSGKLLNPAKGKPVSVSNSTKLMVLGENRYGFWATIYKKSSGQVIRYARFQELN